VKEEKSVPLGPPSFKHRLKRLTGRSWGISIQDRYGHIHVYVTGWMNYFGIGMRCADIMELDHWLRRRMRMCYLKQWGRARKRIGKLDRFRLSDASGHIDRLEQEGFTRKRVPGILPRRMRPTVGCQSSILKIRDLFLYAHCGSGFTIRLEAR
jgi:RNA-directed DNA polymerase